MAALGAASFVQNDLGIVPCELCLLERWPYIIAIGLAVIGVFLPGRFGRLAVSLILLDMLASALLAAFHVGVEWHLWPSPFPECSAPVFAGGSVADQLAAMPAHPNKPCDAATYLVPSVPVSLAALNFLYAAAFFVLLATFTGRRRTY
jgi:disulfide bond formation protein DsbB